MAEAIREHLRRRPAAESRRLGRGRKLFGNPEQLVTQMAIAFRASLSTIDFFRLEIGAANRDRPSEHDERPWKQRRQRPGNAEGEQDDGRHGKRADDGTVGVRGQREGYADPGGAEHGREGGAYARENLA